MSFFKKHIGADALNVLVMVALAATLAVWNAYTITVVLFSLIGVYYLIKRLQRSESPLEPGLSGKLCFVLMGFALISAAINFWHREPAGEYELFIPFMLAPLIILAVLDGHIDRRYLWIGCWLGAILSCLVASYQSYFLGLERPPGFVGSPITFGNNALLLGAIALAGRHDPLEGVSKPAWLILAYLGFLTGLIASLASQSKGGWPLIPFVLVWAVVEDLQRTSRQNRLISFALAFLFVSLAPLLPLDEQLYRVKIAVDGAAGWLQNGQVVEGSTDARLELWKFGLTIWPENPWLGHGQHGMLDRLQEGIAQGEVNERVGIYTGLHNEAIHTLAVSGLAGLFAWASMFIASAIVFGQAYFQTNMIRRTIGRAGLVTVAASLIFGLSDHNLMLNANRQIFVFLIMTLAALEIAEKRKTG